MLPLLVGLLSRYLLLLLRPHIERRAACQVASARPRADRGSFQGQIERKFKLLKIERTGAGISYIERLEFEPLNFALKTELKP